MLHFDILITKYPKLRFIRIQKQVGAFYTFIRVITIILFNVTFSSDNTAQTRSETFANFADEIFSHRGPWTIDGRLQLLCTGVANCTGLASNMRPDTVVEGVQVRRVAARSPWARSSCLTPATLANVCGVCRRTILLEYVVRISGYFSHPRYDFRDKNVFASSSG